MGNEFTDRDRSMLSFVPIFHIPFPFGLPPFSVPRFIVVLKSELT